jgi:outer membrane protein
MKLLRKTMLIGVASLVLTGSSAFAEMKIATVSLQKLFDNYWKTKTANSALEDQQAEMKKSEVEMADSYKKTNDEYQKLLASASDPVITAEERDKRKRDAEAKLKDLKDIDAQATQFQRQAIATLSEKKNRLTKNLLDEIKLAVAGKAKAGGYSLVIDTDSPGVLYTSGENDISDTVLDQLNAGAPADFVKPAGNTNVINDKLTPKDTK